MQAAARAARVSVLMLVIASTSCSTLGRSDTDPSSIRPQTAVSPIPPGMHALSFPADGTLPPARDIEPLCRCKAERQYFHDLTPPQIAMPAGFTQSCPGSFTDPHRNIIAEMEVSTRPKLDVTTTSVEFSAPDGTTIPAWVSRPDDDKAYPAVVYVHGGLGEPALDQPGRTIAAGGFVVISPAYRGTAYEGMSPQQAIRMADPGHLDVEDVHAAADWVQANEHTNGKIALFGSSIGGALVNELAYLYPDRWNAIVDMFGITDWACVMKIVSYGQSSAWVIGAAFGGTPEDRPDEYKKYSPLYHADQITAPFYIAQGLQDTTFPPGASQQWAETLRKAGVDVTFRPYGAEGHSFIIEEPFNSPAWQDLFIWLDRHID